MYSATTHRRFAQCALGLIALAMFVCTSHNLRITNVCNLTDNTTGNASGNAPASSAAFLDTQNPIAQFIALQINALEAKALQNTERSLNESGALNKACTLTDHLVQWHSPQLDHGIFNLLFIVLAFAIFACAGLVVPVLTEPIVPTRRRHLTFCVFRE